MGEIEDLVVGGGAASVDYRKSSSSMVSLVSSQAYAILLSHFFVVLDSLLYL